MFHEAREKQIGCMLAGSGLLPQQKAVLKRYDKESQVNDGLSAITRFNQARIMVSLAKKVKKPFTDMGREDLETFLYGLDLSSSSIDLYKTNVKKFFKWLYRTETYPDIVKWIKKNNHRIEKLPEELLTKEDIKAMVTAADNPRDKAIISLLYESGCRLGEIAALKQKQLTFDQYGAVLIADGKTGQRRIRLINATADLIVWMNCHPRRGAEKPLFVNERKPDKGLEGMGIYYVVKDAARKAEIKKRVHPHLYRHTRFTHLAGDLTETDLKTLGGWVGDSRMVRVYVHRNGSDIDKKLLALEGLITEEARKDDDVLKRRKCPRCSEKNPATAKFCYRCGMALDMETAMKIEKDESGMTLELLDLMKQQPRLIEILQKFSKAAEAEKTGAAGSKP